MVEGSDSLSGLTRSSGVFLGSFESNPPLTFHSFRDSPNHFSHSHIQWLHNSFLGSDPLPLENTSLVRIHHTTIELLTHATTLGTHFWGPVSMLN